MTPNQPNAFVLPIVGFACVGLFALGAGLYVLRAPAPPPPAPPPPAPAQPDPTPVDADPGPPPPTPTPRDPREDDPSMPLVEIVEEPPPQPPRPPERDRRLDTLGPLGPIVLRGVGDWRVSATSDGFVRLRHMDPGAGTLHYFELRPGRRGRLDSAVTVQCDPQQPAAVAGLLYGNTKTKDYFLLGLTSGNRHFLKHRTPSGVKDRLAGATTPGPHRFRFKEADGKLAVFLDGEQRMVLGDGVREGAVIGIFVLGPGQAKFREFDLSYE